MDFANRRTFLKLIAQGAVVAGTGLISTPALSLQSESVLPFRRNAAPLSLHYNENSLGMSPTALQAAKEAVSTVGNRYTMASAKVLKSALATKLSVSDEQIIMGNGSTEIIGAVVAHDVQLNATIIEPVPTFGDLRSRAKAKGLKVIQVPVGQKFETDLAALTAAAKDIEGNVLVNICNPNNPTGTIANQKEMEQWIKTAPENHLFLLDEAYYEYAELNPAYRSGLALIKENMENVVVTRTFSKIYGMAGMRIGYGIAAKGLAKKLDTHASSFNLSAPGIAAAIASLNDDKFFAVSQQSNSQGKAILIETLNQLKLDYIPSDTNFILHRINSDLASYSEKMKMNGIKVGRRMTKDDGWNRLSIGTPEEMHAFSKTLHAFREKGWV